MGGCIYVDGFRSTLEMEGCTVARAKIISAHLEHLWGAGISSNLDARLKITNTTIRDCYAECFMGPMVRSSSNEMGSCNDTSRLHERPASVVRSCGAAADAERASSPDCDADV